MAPTVRSPRMAANDAAVLDSAHAVLERRGWGGLTVAAVARGAALSNRAVHSRFPDQRSLAVAVWSERSGPALLEALSSLTDALRRRSVDDIQAALAVFTRPSPELRVAAELIIVSFFDAALGHARLDLDRFLRESAPVSGDDETRTRSAVTAYATAAALGLLAMERGELAPPDQLAGELRRFARALATPVAPRDLTYRHADHLDVVSVDTGDPIRDALLRAAVEIMGDDGFDVTTTSRVTRAAGISEGAMFNRYGSKLELFLDVVAVYQGSAYRINEEFLQEIERDHSRGVAEAVAIREFMRPSAFRMARTSLEHVRVGWHVPEVGSTLRREREEFMKTMADDPSRPPQDAAYWHVGAAIGLGVLEVAQIYPDARLLPYETVTIPLEDG